MWLLSVDCTKLKYFASPEGVDRDGGFAALSHVWDEEEQSFQDLRRIQETSAKDGTDPRSFVCEKIRRCCELAESHGLKWVWIDTCCIDKTSSAELSEAINSMFQYYALARICYGYLRDVTFTRIRDCDLNDSERRWFADSVWFKRGWTLQELIAPRFFLFVARHWQVLGSKADLAELLNTITGIPKAVLRFEVSHTMFSVAQRLSWYGSRQTTRLEDEAYSLLGLFNIHMPPLYGEGRDAFRRLQEEIMKWSADTTLFAGDIGNGYRSWLLAEQPQDFRYSTDVTYTPPQRKHAQRKRDDPPIRLQGQPVNEMSFSITPHGVLAHVPIIECRGVTYTDLYWTDLQGRKLLILNLDSDNWARASSSPRPLYNVTGTMHCIATADEYTIGKHTARASWQDVLIRQGSSMRGLPGQLLSDTRTPFVPAIPVQLALDAPFRFDEHNIRKFAHEMDRYYDGVVSIRNAEYRLPRQSDSGLPTMYAFNASLASQHVTIVIEVGWCRKVASLGRLGRPEFHVAPRSALQVWARVSWLESSSRRDFDKEDIDGFPEHDCQEDHVSRWSDSRKDFYLTDVSVELECPIVTLSFSPCPVNAGTLVLDASYREHHRR